MKCLLLILVLTLVSCGGGGGSSSTSSSVKTPSYSFDTQTIYSNSGVASLSLPESDKLESVAIYTDSSCQNEAFTLTGEDLLNSTTFNLPISEETSYKYYGVISLLEGSEKLSCQLIFEYVYDTTAPTNLVALPTEIASVDGSSINDSGITLQGSLDNIGSSDDVSIINFYSDSSKTTLLGSMTIEEYIEGSTLSVLEDNKNSTFNLYIAVADAAGNESDSFTTPITITHDNTPPIVATLNNSTATLDNTFSNTDTDYTLDYSVDPSDVTQVEILINGVVVESITSIDPSGDILSSVSIEENQVSEITIVSIDSAGNRNEDIVLTVGHDDISPDAATVSHLLGGSSPTPELIFTHNEESGVVGIYTDSACSSELNLDSNNLVLSSLTTNIATSSQFSVEGSVNLYTKTTDLAGNESDCIASDNISYTYDITPPNLTVTYDQNGGDINGQISDMTLAISGDCEVGSVMAEVVGQQSVSFDCESNTYSGTIMDLSSLADGSYTIQVSHSDIYENASTHTQGFVKDTVSPNEIIFNSATEAKITTGKVKDMCSSLACLEVGVDTLDSDVETLLVFSDSGLTTQEDSITRVDLLSGTDIAIADNTSTTLYLVLEDSVGNRSTAREVAIIHDNIAPSTPTLGSSSSALDSQSTSQFEIDFDITCDADTAYYNLYDDEGVLVESLSTVNWTSQGSHFNLVATADTLNEYSATCLDDILNESGSVSFSFTHNAVLPTIDNSLSLTPDNVGTATLVGSTTIVINPGETGLISLPIGVSSLGFDIVSHTLTLPSSNIYNCLGASTLNTSSLTCEYDYSSETAPFTESINYFATDEWGVESSEKVISIELNEGPNFN